ncbi:hypothetical protein MJO29_012382 [Puccinia striiformis f. sp. tritici]|nr:hypothetical protein MJO29_012382 [Puccinia striiformis f. sp. tritici]
MKARHVRFALKFTNQHPHESQSGPITSAGFQSTRPTSLWSETLTGYSNSIDRSQRAHQGTYETHIIAYFTQVNLIEEMNIQIQRHDF